MIEINVAQQELMIRKDEKILRYGISTAAKGVGQKKGSEKTPLGRHIIRAKIGAGLPLNAVLVGRRFTGEIYSAELANQHPGRDWILTRILWLSGCEIGLNRLSDCDSMQRYIYIHGTPDTEPMGIPRSHGCIRMRNQDVVELFDQVSVGCEVFIQ